MKIDFIIIVKLYKYYMNNVKNIIKHLKYIEIFDVIIIGLAIAFIYTS